MAFLTSTDRLPDGSFHREIPDDVVWAEAERIGLLKGDYGYRWWVYDSEAEYKESLD